MFVEQIAKILLFVACVSCASVPGVSQFKPKPLGIVGGKTINITQAPWQVSLQYMGRHMCGGSIIHPKWILTAAHCTKFIEDELDEITIRAGSSFHKNGGDLLNISRIVQHEHFYMSMYDGFLDFDYALIELDEPIQLDETKQVIKLQNYDEVFSDDTITFTSGWGRTQNPNESRDQLRGVEIPLVSRKMCKRVHEDYKITPRMVCAGFYKEGGKDTCQGDSGGPLVAYRDDDQQPRLVGVVSWGDGCAQPYSPGIYSRVLAVRDWIKSETEGWMASELQESSTSQTDMMM